MVCCAVLYMRYDIQFSRYEVLCALQTLAPALAMLSPPYRTISQTDAWNFLAAKCSSQRHRMQSANDIKQHHNARKDKLSPSIQIFGPLDRRCPRRATRAKGPIVQRFLRERYADAGTYSRLRPLLCSRLAISFLDGTIRRAEHRFAGTDLVIVMLDDIRLRILAHLRDLDVIVRRDASDGDEEAGDVDGGEGVVENDAGGGDGDDFLEDTTDAEGDDGGALQKGEFGGGHEEGEQAGEEEDGGGGEGALCLGEGGEACCERAEPFDGEGDEQEGEEHDWGEVEDAAERVGGRGVAEEQDLCETPAEAGEEGGGDDEDEAEGVEGGFAGDHHDDADGHGGDDEDEFDGWRFEPEEEGEEQHEG